MSFLKPAVYQNGHAGTSDPLDEQHFLVDTVNRIESSRFWRSTAIVIAYDDSDGWYDHQTTDQTSILRFNEDNWLGGERIGDGSFDALAGRLDSMFNFAHRHPTPLYLDPVTGEPAPSRTET